MKNMFASHSKNPSPSNSRTPSPTHHTFSESLMEENLENAQEMINKWDPSHSALFKLTSLFSNRKEANAFFNSVRDLRAVMDYYIAQHAGSEKLVNAQHLMQIAMKRLEREFYQILSTNRDQLDPESISGRYSQTSERSRASTSDTSSDDETETDADEGIKKVEHISMLAMEDLRSIAEMMISYGYGKECVKIYKIIRKSTVDEGLYKLGIQQMTLNQVLKMDWEMLEFKIKNWLHAVKIAVKTLFDGERILCDHVFWKSQTIREACFTEIAKEGALTLFSFPELVAKTKKAPEKMFRVFDLYETILQLWPEIVSIFSFESTEVVRSQAHSAVLKLGDQIKYILSDFESAIHKDNTKTPIPGGGVHPLTRYVMNYVSFLSDYSGSLSDLIAHWPVPVEAGLPESYFGGPDSDDGEKPAIAIRFAWIILVLLCKLDGKTELYKEVSLSYLFLANNLHYVISKVRSSNLRFLLGEDWILNHEVKVKQYAANYERMGWSKVMAALPSEVDSLSREEAKDWLQKFNLAFETTYRTQQTWVVSDAKLRDEIKVSVCKKLVPVYKVFYDNYRILMRGEKNFAAIVRYSPDDLVNYLSDLFHGHGASGSSSGHSGSRG